MRSPDPLSRLQRVGNNVNAPSSRVIPTDDLPESRWKMIS